MPRTARLRRRRRRRILALTALLLTGSLALAAATSWLIQRHRIPEGTPEDAHAEQRWMPVNRSDRWSCIVIHHSAGVTGGAERFDELHRTKGWDELGYHFVIGNGSDTADGQVEVGSRWINQKHGAHCATPDDYYNQHGIGVCLVGNFDQAPPDERQLRSLVRLVSWLCREFQISPDFIYTHGGVTGETRCPGEHFDVEALRKRVAASPALPNVGEPASSRL